MVHPYNIHMLLHPPAIPSLVYKTVTLRLAHVIIIEDERDSVTAYRISCNKVTNLMMLSSLSLILA